MTAANRAKALELVLVHEGGYVNHPADPGGATNKGVTQRVYDAWREKQDLAARSVRHIENAELHAIYRRDYWDKVKGDDLPSGVDYAVFDYAVNSGPGRAARELQSLVLVTPDGAIGPKSLAAVRAQPAEPLIQQYCLERLMFLKSLKHWPTFKGGWSRRVADVERHAREMARAS